MKFPQTVHAARGIGMDKKTLAEALFAEIPPRSKGRTPTGTPTIRDLLTLAAEEVKAETGESYSPATLTDYRDVAAWVANGMPGGTTGITWADASWTAHQEAFKHGLSWDAFTSGKRTKRGARQQAGKSTGDVPAAAQAINEQPAEAGKLVDNLSPQGVEAVTAALGPPSPTAIADAIKADPKAAQAALVALDQMDVERSKKQPREPSKFERFTIAVAAARAAKKNLWKFAQAVSGTPFTPEEQGAIQGMVDDLRSGLDMVVTGVHSGTWDEELRTLLDGAA